MPIKVLELHHHGIRLGTSDDAVEQARQFYGDVLGLEADSGRPNIPVFQASECMLAMTSRRRRFT